MNNTHQHARLIVCGREQIVARVAADQNAAEVAQAFGVSVRTVRKWLAQFREGGAAALQNRSRPTSSKRLSTKPIACRSAMPNSTFIVRHVWIAVSL